MHVCLIDDDPLQLDLMNRIILQMRPGWTTTPLTVKGATAADHGQRLLSEAGDTVDIFLIDQLLGPFTGSEIAPVLAARAPVIIVSDYGAGEPDSDDALPAGVSCWLHKPFNLEDAELVLQHCERIVPEA